MHAKLNDVLYIVSSLTAFFLILWAVVSGNQRALGATIDSEVPVAAAPKNLDGPQLLSRLRAKRLNLHVVSAKRDTDDLRHGFFLSDRSRSWSSLCNVPRLPECIERWTGTVYVERRWSHEKVQPSFKSWGSNGLIVGRLILFGDPQMLARIRDALEG
jgi:hypothetical protein